LIEFSASVQASRRLLRGRICVIALPRIRERRSISGLHTSAHHQLDHRNRPTLRFTGQTPHLPSGRKQKVLSHV
jgi:hypothetical protein